MKTTTLFTHALPLMLAALSCAPERAAQAASPQGAGAPLTGHYCNMGVFSPAEHARLEEQLVPKVVGAVLEKRELENGYAFRFTGRLKEAGEWLDLVRRCCPTLDYQLTFSPGQGPAELRITGEGAGAKAFIREEFRAVLGQG